MRVERVFQIMELVGTVAFAISGVIAGVRHHMDVFGTTVLGLVTAVGGGIVRDMMIGRLPPTVFLHPLCAIVALLTSLFLFFLMYILKAEAGTRLKRPEDILLFVTDTVGLGVFTVLGIETTVQAGYTGRAMLLFVGIITGIGGGIFRDVFSGVIPAVFRKHVYALASAAGALVYVLLMPYASYRICMPAGFVTVVVIRVCANIFKWDLPIVGGKEKREA
ncbi:MAG: hypothetical protein DBY18_02080 [Clostridia bacterium]|mgnify:FL=1|nr:MAG: hypothetical protein DBY18_02080 [Clostridia bacterium]